LYIKLIFRSFFHFFINCIIHKSFTNFNIVKLILISKDWSKFSNFHKNTAKKWKKMSNSISTTKYKRS
jgi:predicted tellurium resistance membrane protein TerC